MIQNRQVLRGRKQPQLCDKQLVIIISGREGTTEVAVKTQIECLR
jgi:hypothetical protein